MISLGTKWWMANSGSHMGYVCVLKERDNRRQGVAGETEVCVSVQILALFVHAVVTDGKENCGCVYLCPCVFEPPNKRGSMH